MGPKATGREPEARRGQAAYLESAAKYLPLLEQHENERVRGAGERAERYEKVRQAGLTVSCSATTQRMRIPQSFDWSLILSLSGSPGARWVPHRRTEGAAGTGSPGSST